MENKGIIKSIYNLFEEIFLFYLSNEKKFKVKLVFIKIFLFVRDNTITYLRSWIFMLRYPRAEKNIFITCIPKVASTYTVKALELGLPKCFKEYRTPQRHYNLTGKGLFRLRYRCSIQHEHMSALERNIKCLKTNGIDKYVLLLRDPRDVIVSYYHHLEKEKTRESFVYLTYEYYELDQQNKITYLIRLFLPRLIDLINTWDSPSKELGELKVLKLYYRDMIQDPYKHFRKILEFYNIPDHLFDQNAINVRKGVRFREGKMDVWKKHFTERQVELANSICGDVLKKHGWTQ